MTAPSAEPLYLDYAASTPPADEVVEAMLPWLRHAHANPHSEHWHGRRAAQAVEIAREAVASLIGAPTEGIVFTSGATEANNLALKGILSQQGPRRQLWLADIEHKSLLEPARALAAAGVLVQRLAVDPDGVIHGDALAAALAGTPNGPGLVAVAHGNNEIGTLQPIAALAELAHTCGHLLHVDASQSAGRVAVDVEALDCDLLCLSSHKLYGPGGIGALYVAPELRAELRPLLHGGGQEGGQRSGTVAPFLAVGFGAAARLAQQRRDQDHARQEGMAAAFLAALRQQDVDHALIGHPQQRLPGHLSLRFPGVDAEDLATVLAPSLSTSTGAACAAGEVRASHVLRAVGLDERTAGEVLRLTFGRASGLEHALRAAAVVAAAIQRIRTRSG